VSLVVRLTFFLNSFTASSSTAHYVRKWSEEGSRPDVRVTRSVNHAIYLAFGTTLAPDDILRFVISTDLGYQSLVATTLYVPTLRVLSLC
jgi:hypothetical protein